MKEHKDIEVVDALVKQYLESEAATVDGPALLERARQSRARRRRRRRIIWVALAAACLALALTLFATRPPPPKRPVFSAGIPDGFKAGALDAGRTLDRATRTVGASITQAVDHVGDIVPAETTPVVPQVARSLAVSLSADAAQMRGNFTQFVNDSLRKAGLLI